MRFYRIHAAITKIDRISEEETNDDRVFYRDRVFIDYVRSKTEEINRRLAGRAIIALSKISNNEAILASIDCELTDLRSEAKRMLKAIGLTVGKLTIEETTFDDLRTLLRYSDRHDFINDEDIIYSDFDLDCFTGPYRKQVFNEDIIKPVALNKIRSQGKNFLTYKDLKAEMDRIKESSELANAYGHPVHYIIHSDDNETRDFTNKALLSCLIKSKRIRNSRVSSLECTVRRGMRSEALDSFFSMNKGGALIVSFDRSGSLEDYYADEDMDIAESFCECLKRYRNDVLVIMNLSLECAQLKNLLFENLGNLSFVEIREEAADIKESKRFLKKLAEESKVEMDIDLESKIKTSETYLTSELRAMYEEWHGNKLRTYVYPQYAKFQMAKMDEVKKEAEGNAYEELMEMIGLDGAKKLICQAIDFHKMQKFLASKEITREQPMLHMSFTGNPGTAKTTVARLFARIMRENELLSSGHIVEVGRKDLVGKYVGHTAPLIQKHFKRASGGVLFIDEAYSLVDDRHGMFGDEAINTIVQEMENNRDNVVVIFAGYPDEMERFMQQNPGLRSRVPYHISFDDYNSQELCEIASLIASKKKLILTEDAKTKLKKIFESVCYEPDFGNGRMARSIIEDATMTQATRLVSSDLDSISKTELNTIIAEDIKEPVAKKIANKSIGFCA